MKRVLVVMDGVADAMADAIAKLMGRGYLCVPEAHEGTHSVAPVVELPVWELGPTAGHCFVAGGGKKVSLAEWVERLRALGTEAGIRVFGEGRE